MELIFILLVVFVGGGWLLGKATGTMLFPKNQNDNPHKTEIHHHHYHTENHLHVTKEDLKSLSNKKD